jgi:GcrA cell cycle regulator
MEWNDTLIAELTRLWREGFSASQVARQLGGVTRSAVISKVHRLGISCHARPSRPRGQGPLVRGLRTLGAAPAEEPRLQEIDHIVRRYVELAAR